MMGKVIWIGHFHTETYHNISMYFQGARTPASHSKRPKTFELRGKDKVRECATHEMHIFSGLGLENNEAKNVMM